MNRPEATPREHSSAAHEPVAFSNGVRLTRREWIGIAAFTVALLFTAPPLWEQVEPFEPNADYRIPYELSNDYWLYNRYTKVAASKQEVLVIGDSVVWGPYVTPRETLSHYLNEQAGADRFANLGLNGAHPAALAGLLEYYAQGVSAKKVLLQCNPLWLTSPVQDLQEEAQAPFNHPDLVPQFFPRIPRYRAEWSKRIGVAVTRRIPFTAWTRHLQEAYFNQTDIPGWTLEHPYDNPGKPLGHSLAAPEDRPREEPVPWFTRGRKPEAVAWVDLDQSLQWHSFQRAVRLLKERGNRVFVLVGPYNEHMLTAPSRQHYQEIKGGIERWLQDQQIPHMAPPVLPRDEYGDASHPLAPGYRRLADQLHQHPFFNE